MAHASPRPTPTRGSSPPLTPGTLRAHTGFPAWGGAAHTSLGGPPILNAAPPQPVTLEIEEVCAGHGTGVTYNNSTDSSFCHSRAADSLAARLQCDELNTPDINPLTPFQFPTTLELEDSPTFMDEGLMDAILSASKEEVGEETTSATTTPTSGTELTHSTPVTSRTFCSLGAANVSSANAATMQAPAFEIAASSSIVVGGIPCNVILAPPSMIQPSMLNSDMAVMSNVPLWGADNKQAPLAHFNSENASVPINRLCSITVPHDSDMAPTDQLGIPYDPGNMTNQTNVHFNHQPSVGYANVDTSGSLDKKYPNLFIGNSEIEGAGAAPYCTGSISSHDEFPQRLDLDVHNQSSVADVKPPTTMLPVESELLTSLDAIDPNDAFLYSGGDLPPTVDNLLEMNEEEMKVLEEFCEKFIDDKTDLWSTPIGNEEHTSEIAVGSAVGELDHFGLLSSSQEPGQLLASKLRTNKSLYTELNDIKPSRISEETREFQRSLNAEEPEVSSGRNDEAPMNFFPGDADNFGSLSGVQTEAGFQFHSTHHYLNQNLDLNTPASTPLRRPNTPYADKKGLDNNKLKEKLEQHLRTQEYSSTAVYAAGVGGCRDGSSVDFGARANVRQPSQVALPNSFHLEFDTELNVPSKEAPAQAKPGKVIKVEVMKENRSRLHAPQKPLKRLGSESSPCFSIRTKKFKVASSSSSGKNCNVFVPAPIASSSGVGQKACFNVATNASQNLRESETPSSYCPSGKIILGARGNTCNVGLPGASVITPRYLVIRSTNRGISANVGGQMANDSVNSKIGNGVHPSDHSLGFAAPLTIPVLSTVAPQNQVYSASSISADVLAMSKASQPLASVVSTAATCKTSSNGSRLKAEFTVNASSKPNLCVAGPSNYRPAVANIPPADEAACYSDDSSDASVERPTKGRRARGSSSVVGFSRLPRSEQVALDAKKYRKNLQANNLASTKSRLKKKNARLALEREFELLSNQKIERERLFYKLKSQYDVMNRMEVARPCCRGNN